MASSICIATLPHTIRVALIARGSVAASSPPATEKAFFGSWPPSSEISTQHIDQKKSPPPGGFPIYYVPSSRTVSKRTPLEALGTSASKGVLLRTVLDQGT